MFGREAAKIALGAFFCRWMMWTVVIYFTAVFYMTSDFSGITIVNFLSAMVLSGLSTFGFLSLVRDIRKGRAKESIVEIWDMINGKN
jgi:hypothetical protein